MLFRVLVWLIRNASRECQLYSVTHSDSRSLIAWNGKGIQAFLRSQAYAYHVRTGVQCENEVIAIRGPPRETEVLHYSRDSTLNRGTHSNTNAETSLLSNTNSFPNFRISIENIAANKFTVQKKKDRNITRQLNTWLFLTENEINQYKSNLNFLYLLFYF